MRIAANEMKITKIKVTSACFEGGTCRERYKLEIFGPHTDIETLIVVGSKMGCFGSERCCGAEQAAARMSPSQKRTLGKEAARHNARVASVAEERSKVIASMQKASWAC